MARKILIYIATSLNNRIAAKDGSVEWLESIPHKEGEDYGYQKFYDSIATTVMGYSTYAQLKSWDIPFPYKDKKNYVITTKPDRAPDEDVEFISESPVAFFRELKQQEGNDIWLVGGGQMNTLLHNAGLVDELIMHIMPVILEGGIEMFGGLPQHRLLQLQASKTYESGVVELHYKVLKEA